MEDASIIVPKAMWWSYVLNVVLGIVVLISKFLCWTSCVPQPSVLNRHFIVTKYQGSSFKVEGQC